MPVKLPAKISDLNLNDELIPKKFKRDLSLMWLISDSRYLAFAKTAELKVMTFITYDYTFAWAGLLSKIREDYEAASLKGF